MDMIPYLLFCAVHIQELGVEDSNDARARFFFDISFFIIVTTIGLNIVFGIIVDTFSELRDEKVRRITELLHLGNSTTSFSLLLNKI